MKWDGQLTVGHKILKNNMSKIKFFKKTLILGKFYSQILLMVEEHFSASLALLALLLHWWFFFGEWLTDGNLSSSFVEWSCAVKDNTIVLWRILILSIVREIYICGALRDLVLFVQFEKRKKHPWRSVNFSKIAGLKLALLLGVFHVFKIVQMVPNRAMDHISFR